MAVVDDWPTKPSLLQACSWGLTDRVLARLWGIEIRDEWRCSRCGATIIGWPGNGMLCAVLTNGDVVEPK